ncbi:hypothetical protein WL14_20950 [Burkholderia cepacia]|uniref:hypothetical protein n=1 Tax=Burkholderia cepacia TaxID=292 RepID=UPI000760A194|nr:hypothetical protein [Burkholderia cepacia]KVZ22352.1 hypothetical protein WL14_20950 [Burkholderia cepacia]
MKTCHEIRREQLRALIEELGSVGRLSELIGKTDTQIRQWVNASKDSRTGKPRGISDDIARHIEEKTGKEIGWLDNDPEIIAGWSRLSDMQRAQVIGFVNGLLAQSTTARHSTPFVEEGDTPGKAGAYSRTRKAG